MNSKYYFYKYNENLVKPFYTKVFPVSKFQKVLTLCHCVISPKLSLCVYYYIYVYAWTNLSLQD